MNANDAIRASMDLSLTVIKKYVEDLEDDDLLRRPVAGCNSLAWQLGHLISSEAQLLEGVNPGSAPALPEGFAEAHSREVCQREDTSGFESKQAYVELFDRVRAASRAVLDGLSEADFDKESPEAVRNLCPTIGDIFTLIALHPMMHAGQFVIVRRQLGKPVVI